MMRTDYPELAFEASFRAYSAQRDELMRDLQWLSPADWSRSATVTGSGAPLQRTVRGYAERLVRHERPHATQIDRIVAVVRA